MADRKGSSVDRYYASKQKRQKKKRAKVYAALIFLCVAVLITLSLTVFFNIRSFEIAGNTAYTKDQIIGAAGLKEGDNLFRLNKFKIADRLAVSLPYIESVEIYRKLPTTLCMNVTECRACFVAGRAGSYVLLSDKRKVLAVTEKLPSGVAYLIGDTVKEPKPGYTASFGEAAESYLGEVIDAVLAVFPADKIGAIDLTDRYNLRLYYDGDRVKILLGNTEDLLDKLQMAKEAVDKNSTVEKARIDVTDSKKAYYRVLDEEEIDDLAGMLEGKSKAKPDKIYEIVTDTEDGQEQDPSDDEEEE